MKREFWKQAIAGLLSAQLMVASSARGEDRSAPPKRAAETAMARTATLPAGAAAGEICDIVLGDRGHFSGQVVDGAGQAVAGLEVVLAREGQQVAACYTDATGNFTATGLSGGLYLLSAGETCRVCRLWAPHTEPPSATRSVLVVSDAMLVRGQSGRGFWWWATNPWVLAAALGAAIAVPIALANDRASSS